MDERSRFMATIRSALGYPESEKRGPEDCPGIFADNDDNEIVETIRYRTTVEKQGLMAILRENSRSIHLHLDTVSSFDAAADKIVAIIRKSTPEFSDSLQVIQHDHPDIIGLQLWKRLAGEAVFLHTTYSADTEIREKTIASSIGITVPQWVIADSASIVQLTVAGQPRSTSLLPSVHIAVVRIKYLLADLSELYALLRRDRPSDSFVLISGPSKTADIEAHMVHGAHGPREVFLIVVDEFMEEGTVLPEEAFLGAG